MFNTNVNSENFDPSGNKEPHVISSTNGNLSLLFNLGQLNVDASMGVNPIFQAIENLEVDVPDASVNVVSEVSMTPFFSRYSAISGYLSRFVSAISTATPSSGG